MAGQNELSVGNSVIFQLTLTNPMLLSSAVNNATVEVILYDPDGVAVAGQAWPLNLPYVERSSGIYRETIAPIPGLVDGVIYTAVFTATGADGLIGRFSTNLKARGD